MPQDPLRTLTQLLDALQKAAEHEPTTVRTVIHELGDRSILPFILLIAIVLISPISGVPGVPTVSAAVLFLLAIQAISGRSHLWLPDFLLRRSVSSKQLDKSVNWLRRPTAFVDRHSHPRLRFLTGGPMRTVALLICAVLPLFWPFLELLPMVTSIGAGIIALLSFGLFTRDGFYALSGYVLAAGWIAIGVYLARTI